jgi:pimeloyl-ACP methyl ester carboxylesterase
MEPSSESAHRRRGVIAVAAVAAATAVVVGIALIASRGRDPGFDASPVVWGWCPGMGVECGLLEVPIDHEHPDRGTITVEVARREATDPAQRVGVLVLLPGGPGDDGTALVQLGNGFSDALRERFDIVSYNPRGFSPGTEIDCRFPETPPPSDAVAAQRSYTARRARACAANAGLLAAHVSAVDLARDVEVLRRTLGEERISLLGVSYGTAVGAVYQSLFPDRVRASVLDGAFDLRADLQEGVLEDLRAAERALAEMLRRCSRFASCPFHNDGRPRAALVGLLDELARSPRIVSGRRFTVVDAQGAILQSVGWDAAWPQLATALAAAQTGDLSPLAQLGQHGSRIPDANVAYACGDRPASAFRSTPADVAAWRRAAPVLARHESAASWAVGLCDGWPHAPTLPPELRRASAPTLVVGATGDTRTPLASSREVAERLEAPLLVVRQFAHTAYRGRDFPEPTCVTRTVDAALIETVLPPTGLVCPGDAPGPGAG